MKTKQRSGMDSVILCQHKETIECVLIRNFNMTYQTRFLDICASFSKSAAAAFALLQQMTNDNQYDEAHYLEKVGSLVEKDFYTKLLQAEVTIDLDYYFAQYEQYAALIKQAQLIDYLENQTREKQVVTLDVDFLKSFQYQRSIDDYKTFEEAKKEAPKEYVQYATHVDFLDEAFSGGIALGQLILISGDYECGKTTLATQIIENMTRDRKVAFFCFEFTLDSYIRRRETQPNAMFNEQNMIVINEGYDIREIQNHIIRLHDTRGVKVFLIDSQMRVENNYTQANHGEEKESEKFEILGKLAHSKNLIIILIIQTSKADSDSPFKSKKGGHEASVIIHLERPGSGQNGREPIMPQALEKRLITFKKNKQVGNKRYVEDICLDVNKGMFVKDPKHQKSRFGKVIRTINIDDIAGAQDL